MSMESELKAALADDDYVYIKEFMKTTTEWESKTNPVGYLIKAARERWPLRFATAADHYEMHRKDARRIKESYEDKLLDNCSMDVQPTHFLIMRGQKTLKFFFKLSDEEWLAELNPRLKEMHIPVIVRI